MGNILISTAGKRVVLLKIFKETVKQLGVDAQVFTTDANPLMAPASVVSNGAFKVPYCQEPSYIDQLLELCKQHNITLVVPTIDTELLLLSRAKQRFAQAGINVMVSSPTFVQACGDKRLTAHLLEQLHMRVPRSIDAKRSPVFPMFAKPYDGSLSSDIHYIYNSNELTPELLDNPKLMFMELVDKRQYKEFTVDMYYGIDGKLKCLVPRERLAIRAGEINKGITRRNGIVGYLRQRMDHMPDVTGAINLQLFYRPQDEDIIVIEINPRFGGGYPLSFHAGANFAEYAIREYLFGQQLAFNDNWDDGTLMLRYDADVIVHTNGTIDDSGF